MDWNAWKDIGKEFIIKSNINDWVVCQPNEGSIVTRKTGLLGCQNVKNVATTCSGVVPHKIIWESRTPTLRASPFYYDFDGSTTDGNWPAHDPCAVDGQNH